MSANSITKQDLINFKSELLQELTKFYSKLQKPYAQKLLKSKEVRELLRISPGTLQTLKKNGTLSSVKIGGTQYYPHLDILRLIEASKNPKG